MADELRLEASVVDKFSKPLRDLRDRLRDVKTPDSVRQMSGEFAKIEGAVKNATRSIEGGLSTAMSGLGLTGLAATASVAGVIAAVKNFSGSTIELKQFSRETGFTIATLKALKHAASSFGVNEETVGPALKKFSDSLRDIQRHRPGSVFDELVKIDPQLMKALTGKNADQALDIVEQQMAEMSKTLEGRQQAQKLAEALFGTGEMARYALQGMGPLREAFSKFYKAGSGPTDGDEKNARAFAQSVEQLQESFSHMSKVVGKEVTPQLTAVMDAITKFIEANEGKVGESLKNAFTDVGAALKKVDWKTVGDELVRIGEALVKISNFILSTSDPKRYERQRSGGADDERKNAPDMSDPRVRDALRQKSSYDGGGLLHRMSFGSGGGTTGAYGLVETMAAGTKIGFVAAIRELRGEQELDKAGGGGGGFQQASYGGGAGGGSGSGGGGRSRASAAVRRAVGNIGGGFGGKVQRGAWWTPDRQKHAVDRLMGEAGLSRDGAEGLVSRWANVEAGAGPTALNPKSGAAGIGQWLGSRKHDFTVDYDSQLKHAIDEINHNENPAATRALRGAKNAREGAIGASRFERAEDYNARTGTDRWTEKSLAGAAKVHREVESAISTLRGNAAAKKGGPGSGANVPMPDHITNWTPPNEPHERGSLLRQQRKDEGGGGREPAELNITMKGMPKANYHADGGDHFGRINIDPGRTRMWES